MSWSNAASSRNGLQSFTQWRAERGPRPSSLQYNPAYEDHLARKRGRPTGTSLKASEVAGLVEKALASGPIAPGEPFEHLLVVTSDQSHMHVYHYITAEPAGSGMRRMVLLSDRTVHVAIDLKRPPRTREFTEKLLAYADALGTPRVIVDDQFVQRFLMFEIRHTLKWSDADAMGSTLCDGPRSKFGNNLTLGLARYRKALSNHVVKHPELKVLAEQAKGAELKPYNGGGLEVDRPDLNVGRDLMAMCLAYIEHDMSQSPTFSRSCCIA